MTGYDSTYGPGAGATRPPSRPFPWRFACALAIPLLVAALSWGYYRLGVEHGKGESERALRIATGQLERDRKNFERYAELLDQCRALGWREQPLVGAGR